MLSPFIRAGFCLCGTRAAFFCYRPIIRPGFRIFQCSFPPDLPGFRPPLLLFSTKTPCFLCAILTKAPKLQILSCPAESKKQNPFQMERVFGFRFYTANELALRNRAYRAGTCTAAAIDASIRVDLVLAVALSDRAYRALARAGTTADACATDNICHWYCTSISNLHTYCNTRIKKSNQKPQLAAGNFYQCTQILLIEEKPRKTVIS